MVYVVCSLWVVCITTAFDLQWDLGRGYTEHGGEVVLYPVSLCKVRGSLDNMIVSDLDSVDSNTPPPLQREGVCCSAMCSVTSSGLLLYYIPPTTMQGILVHVLKKDNLTVCFATDINSE